MIEIFLIILPYVLFFGFIGILFLGASALDGAYDTWCMNCLDCKKRFKAKKSSYDTVILNCVHCGSTNTKHIAMISVFCKDLESVEMSEIDKDILEIVSENEKSR